MRKGDLDEAVFAFIKAQMDVFLDMEKMCIRDSVQCPQYETVIPQPQIEVEITNKYF